MESRHIGYDKLFAFAADELAAREADDVASHTANCPACSQTAKRFITMRRLMLSDDSVEPPRAALEQAHAVLAGALALTQHVAYPLLVAFAADDLEPVDAKNLAPHIAYCSECSATVTRLQRILTLWRQDDGYDPPFPTRVRARAIFPVPRLEQPPSPWWQDFRLSIPVFSTRRLAMASVLVLFILSSVLAYATLGRVVSAVREAIPGDTLYSVKLAFEDIELVTTWDTAGKVDKHIAFAGYRLEETAALVNLQRLAEIPATLAAFERETNLIVQTFGVLAKENSSRAQELGAKVQAAVADHSIKLANLRDAAGDAVKPLIHHAIAASDASQKTVQQVVDELLSPSATPALGTLTPTSVPRPATRVVPSSTGVPGATFTAMPFLPRQNTPTAIVPTTAPAVVKTAPPPSPVFVPVATQTPRPPVIVPTATPRPTLTPTEHIPPGQLKKTLTPQPLRPSSAR